MKYNFQPTPPLGHYIPTRTPTPFISVIATPAAPCEVGVAEPAHNPPIGIFGLIVIMMCVLAWILDNDRKIE